jgi:hypothetical protein
MAGYMVRHSTTLLFYRLTEAEQSGWLGLWTDGTDQEVDGVWRWSGSHLTLDPYTHWVDGEPTGTYEGLDEDCLAFLVSGGFLSFEWYDGACHIERAFICEL